MIVVTERLNEMIFALEIREVFFLRGGNCLDVVIQKKIEKLIQRNSARMILELILLAVGKCDVGVSGKLNEMVFALEIQEVILLSVGKCVVVVIEKKIVKLILGNSAGTILELILLGVGKYVVGVTEKLNEMVFAQ